MIPYQSSMFKFLNSSKHENIAQTYISIKIEPKGKIPPRQTITAGSINLENNIINRVLLA